MIINFERDMLWPDATVKVATWGAGEASLAPPISQDGTVLSHQGYLRGPGAVPGISSNRMAYGQAYLPPNPAERCVYRVQADGDGQASVGYAFLDVSGGAGDVNPADADFVYLGNLPVDMAVAVPPHASDPSLSLVFCVVTGDDTLAYSFLSVQRLVGRPPSFASSVS